ncbi:hypothetical protein SAMN05421796_11174 [Chryseobacterium piscicola]|uniref:EpsG family protein n=1 Tax=Chryseobacterium piscicola TaxID=551459 RepID=A0A1N7P6H1_9FLAO|nr:hypothetical protein [Chryseobacterium piscicola]PQA94260.1 hypothetical protein B0A70_07370 [Chryseobacterium piscicola]SIT06235.1 hypothetical protein SAMN05421796_11174 [Chryseobacterium piscicola]
MKKLAEFFTVRLLINVLILATAVFALIFTFIHNQKSDGYILGDWLINYQDGGFKRRGLSGSFFFLIQDFTGLKLNLAVYFFQVIIICGFFYTYFTLIQRKKPDLFYLSLLLSSIGFVGVFNCVDYVGKKEFVAFLLFAVFINLLEKDKLSCFKEYLICLGLVISMLFHEITLFFVPYFLIGLYLKSAKFEPQKYIKYILATFIPAGLLFFFGKEINEGHSLEILKDRGVVLTKGIFFWNFDEKKYIIDHFNEYRLYFLSFIISVAHVGFYLKFQKAQKFLSILLILAFLFSLPLFYLAIDWGRWLYIHMIFIIVLLTLNLPKRNSDEVSRGFRLNVKNGIVLSFILFSLMYRVEMSGKGFTWQGLLYRVFISPIELLNKML